MIKLLENYISQMSRRDFLKFSGTSLLSLMLAPYFDLGWLPNKPQSPDSLEHKYGRVISSTVDVFLKPSAESKMVTTLWQDSVLPIQSVTIGDDESAYNRIWYELGSAGFVHSGKIQPVDIQPNEINQVVPESGIMAEVSVPFTDAVWHPKSPHLVTYRLYFGSVFWINAVLQDKDGKSWYRISDDKWDIEYYVDATHMHIVQPEEMSALSTSIPEQEKRIEIILAEQAVIAYEYDQPVFLARTATGARFIDGDYRTPVGNYITNRKRPSRHMAAGDPAAANSYDLPGIPWVSYLTEKGISFHGTYWHNDYGKPRSHGCINLTPDDARWIYRWSNPAARIDEETVTAKTGTKVAVI